MLSPMTVRHRADAVVVAVADRGKAVMATVVPVGVIVIRPRRV